MSNKIVLGLDLDGPLYDFHSALYTYCQYELDYGGTYSEFWLDYIQNASQERQDYLMNLPFLYESVVPHKCVTEFLKFAKENATDIYYITHRPKDMEVVTRRYLKRYNFPYPDNLFMTGDKATTCRYLGVTHFLDDHIKHVKAVSAVADSYLMAKPWNREFRDDFNTVYSLKEFKDAVFGRTD